MGRDYGRMWRVVPCTSKKILRTESNKNIEEILKTKLATIIEEPEPTEICEDKWTLKRLQLQVAKTMKKKKKKSGSFVPKFGFRESYALIMASGFTSKASFGEYVRH